jgi:hypothetical protein
MDWVNFYGGGLWERDTKNIETIAPDFLLTYYCCLKTRYKVEY